VGFESKLRAVICGVELDIMIYDVELVVVIYGVELSARSSATSNRATKLNGVETCNFDAVNYGVNPRVQS
jgi:hypothetical protein